MRAVPAARYLVEFGREDRAASAPEPVVIAPVVEPIELRLEAAYRRGRDEALADAEATVAAAQADFEGQLQAKITAARAVWIAELGDTVATSLSVGWRELRDSIGEMVAATLKPVIVEARREMIIADLKRAIDTLVATDAPSVLTLEGPADLIERLSENLSGVRVELRASDSVDVRVRADRTLIETRLAAWVTHLANA